MRIKMSKKRQAAIATIAGGALLLGAGGTYSIWTATADAVDNDITTGHLAVTASATDWKFTGPGDGRVWTQGESQTMQEVDYEKFQGNFGGTRYAEVEGSFLKATHKWVTQGPRRWVQTSGNDATHYFKGGSLPTQNPHERMVRAEFRQVTRSVTIEGSWYWAGVAANVTPGFLMIPGHTVTGTTQITSDLAGTGLKARLTVKGEAIIPESTAGSGVNEIEVTWKLGDHDLGEGTEIVVSSADFKEKTTDDLVVTIVFPKDAKGTMGSQVVLDDIDVELTQVIDNYDQY